jgi:hypothetical protein
LPSSFPPKDATRIASTAENWAKSDSRVLAEPPRVFSTEWARVTLDGVGWKGSESVWVRKRVPDATIRNGRLTGEIDSISWPWRRRAIELRTVCQVYSSSCQGAGTVMVYVVYTDEESWQKGYSGYFLITTIITQNYPNADPFIPLFRKFQCRYIHLHAHLPCNVRPATAST